MQTTSMKNAENGVLWARWSAFWAQWCQSWWPCWQHEPFHAQLNPIGGMVGSLPKPPPIGLTCASMDPGVHLPGLGHHLSGPRAGHRASMRVKVPACAGCVHRNRRGPEGLAGVPTLPMPPRIRRRRDPEGSRLSLRAVAAPSALKIHATSNTQCPITLTEAHARRYKEPRGTSVPRGFETETVSGFRGAPSTCGSAGSTSPARDDPACYDGSSW